MEEDLIFQEPTQTENPQSDVLEEVRLQLQQQAKQKALRRQGNIQGGALLIYKAIMNVTMFVAIFAIMVGAILVGSFSAAVGPARPGVSQEGAIDALLQETTEVMVDAMGWAYLAAVAIGWLILRLWKKNAFFKNEIYKQGRPMGIGAFCALVCLVFGCQLPAQLLSLGIEWVCNQFGGSLMEILQESNADTDQLPMWLYVCLAAPIWEEIAFRGLLMRSLEPFGKKLAVTASAVLFGLYHGSPIQTPYAILVGFVLGYVAMEYNVIWAMVLHMMNNLLLGDSLPRLLECLPYQVADTVMWAILIVFFLAAVIVLLLNWPALNRERRLETVQVWERKAFWKSPCVIILCVWSLLDLVYILAMAFF